MSNAILLRMSFACTAKLFHLSPSHTHTQHKRREKKNVLSGKRFNRTPPCVICNIEIYAFGCCTRSSLKMAEMHASKIKLSLLVGISHRKQNKYKSFHFARSTHQQKKPGTFCNNSRLKLLLSLKSRMSFCGKCCCS